MPRLFTLLTAALARTITLTLPKRSVMPFPPLAQSATLTLPRRSAASLPPTYAQPCHGLSRQRHRRAPSGARAVTGRPPTPGSLLLTDGGT
ncbi:hypothetical protein AAFF_G00273690 [Aldrovandia affinis]|uniref:Secreted protein n=1 Tax=Aldrovandia affinis TaxID=143900 RepID=A0AAD7SSS5_9TELE|nr:hypothetical protein AAFF_G00273690 [Aldrovandia affinis]